MVTGSSIIRDTGLFLSKIHYPLISTVLVQPKKTGSCPNMMFTEA